MLFFARKRVAPPQRGKRRTRCLAKKIAFRTRVSPYLSLLFFEPNVYISSILRGTLSMNTPSPINVREDSLAPGGRRLSLLCGAENNGAGATSISEWIFRYGNLGSVLQHRYPFPSIRIWSLQAAAALNTTSRRTSQPPKLGRSHKTCRHNVPRSRRSFSLVSASVSAIIYQQKKENDAVGIAVLSAT